MEYLIIDNVMVSSILFKYEPNINSENDIIRSITRNNKYFEYIINPSHNFIIKCIREIPTRFFYGLIPKKMITTEIIDEFITHNINSIFFIENMTQEQYTHIFNLNIYVTQYIPSQYRTQTMIEAIISRGLYQYLSHLDKKFITADLCNKIPTTENNYISLIPAEYQTLQMCRDSIFQRKLNYMNLQRKFNYTNLQWCSKIDAQLLDDIYRAIHLPKHQRMNFISSFHSEQIIHILTIKPNLIINININKDYAITALNSNPRMLKYVINRYDFPYDYIKLAMANITNAYLFNAWWRVLLKLYPEQRSRLFYVLTKEYTVILILKQYLIDDISNIIMKLYCGDIRYNNKTINKLLTTILIKNDIYSARS